MRIKPMLDIPGYTSTLDNIIVALCADYQRREDAIREGSVSRRTEMEYRYINYRIFDGVAEVVGADDALTYIYEIGRKIGYAKSKIDISELSYKNNKLEIKINVACKLHLFG